MRAPITEWGEDPDVFQTYCLSDHELFVGTAYVEISYACGSRCHWIFNCPNNFYAITDRNIHLLCSFHWSNLNAASCYLQLRIWYRFLFSLTACRDLEEIDSDDFSKQWASCLNPSSNSLSPCPSELNEETSFQLYKTYFPAIDSLQLTLSSNQATNQRIKKLDNHHSRVTCCFSHGEVTIQFARHHCMLS